MVTNLKNRDQIFSFLDSYSSDMKSQIDLGKTKQPLLKSYIFETFNEEINNNFSFNIKDYANIISGGIYELTQIDESLFALKTSGGIPFGFIEIINNRFFVLYAMEKSNFTDQYTSKIVKNSPLIDNLWISGKLFDGFLKQIVDYHNPHRYLTMNFEFDGMFESKVPTDGHELYEEDNFEDTRLTKISLSKELEEIETNLKGIRGFLPEFHSIGLLKFPTMVGKGGHYFYRNGKVTNRSNSFKDHRYHIFQNVDSYKKITEDLESNVWLDFERIKSPDMSVNMSFNGIPITFKFSKELKKNVFNNFIEYSFKQGREPFKIIGNPIRVNDNRVHIYGMDLHLWQEVMLDLSCDKFTLFLPRGTCGNTIHRIATNIQRYLDPAVNILIGNKEYEDYINKHLGELDSHE
ncbi:hypothetical protein [Sutcliffiella cohnii]|uniref:hypothetical protein n=1 Tax=Sutcliffiella cohnii TaxID=33932 RepID=UPI000831057A|nr:hypothetical protein [Sutcliffiella cohnii]